MIEEVVESCFRVTALSAPTKGTATLSGDRTVVWSIAELGTTGSEGASLTFTVEHNGVCSGTLPVNESITYADTEGNVVTFDDPEIEVDCGKDVYPERPTGCATSGSSVPALSPTISTAPLSAARI